LPPPSSTLSPYTTLFRSPHEHHLGRVRGAQEPGHTRPRRLVALRRPARELVEPTVHVGVVPDVELRQRIQHRPRTLRGRRADGVDRKSTRLNSSHVKTSY